MFFLHVVLHVYLWLTWDLIPCLLVNGNDVLLLLTGDMGSIPGSGRSPGEGNGNPLQYSCLKNPMDRGAWWATVPGFPEEPETT